MKTRELFTELSSDELTRMEARASAATAGPWYSCVVGRDSEAGLSYIEIGLCQSLEVVGGTAADQDFIAAARTDVPRLIDEVRKLRARLEVARSAIALDVRDGQAGTAQSFEALSAELHEPIVRTSPTVQPAIGR